MAASENAFPGGFVRVEMVARGSDMTDDAQTASRAVATWLETQNLGNLSQAFDDFVDEMEGEGEHTILAAWYERLIQRAYRVARAATTDAWVNPNADVSILISIEPAS